jgi:hypothetical protein
MRKNRFSKLLALVVLPMALTPFTAQAFYPVRVVAPGLQPAITMTEGVTAQDHILRITCHDAPQPQVEEPQSPVEEPQPPVVVEPQPPVVEEPQPPVVEQAQPPVEELPSNVELLQSTGGALSDDCDDDVVDSVGVSKAATDRIVKALNDADRTCNDMRLVPPPKGVDQKLYRIDCYRLMYRKIAEAMPKTGDYAPIRRALLAASDKLNQIVRANLDTSAPKITVRERGKRAAPAIGPIRAIRPDRIKVAQAKAEAVIKETAIVILRSGEIPTRRNVHYAKVSAAVEENLVVLRSA